MVDLQCFVNFCYIAKWPSYIYIYIYVYIYIYTYVYIFPFSHIIFYHVLSQVIGYSSLCYSAVPHCLSILNVVDCIHEPQTPSPSHSLSHAPPLYVNRACLCPYSASFFCHSTLVFFYSLCFKWFYFYRAWRQIQCITVLIIF